MEFGATQKKWNPAKIAGSFLLCMITLIFLVLLFPQKIHAATDTTPPAVTGIRYVNSEVTKPGVVVVELDIVEEETGVSCIEIWACSAENPYPLNSNFSASSDIDFNTGRPQYTGKIKIEIPLNARNVVGTWVTNCIYLKDKAGNSTTISTHTSPEATYYNDQIQLNGIDSLNPTFTVKDEFDYDFEYSLSNPKLPSRLQTMEEGKVARLLIDSNSNGILPKAAFDAIRGKDKTIVAYSTAYQWIFNGKDITNKSKDIDLNLTLKKQSGAEYGSAEDVVKATFPANGVLPGKAQVRIKSDYIYRLEGIKGKLYLYYLNDGKLEVVNNPNFDLVFNGTDKWCYFDVTHNSTYIISGNKLAAKNGTAQTITGTTKYTKKVTDKSFSLNMKAKTPLSYKSSNTKVVQVAKNGKVTIKGIGTAKITVTAAKSAKYAATKKVVTVTVNPAGTSILSASSKSKSTATTAWKRDSKASGYQIRYSTNSKFTGKSVKYTTVKSSRTTSAKLQKLTSKRKYYVQVRSFKKVNGKTYNSSWSKAKAIKIK